MRVDGSTIRTLDLRGGDGAPPRDLLDPKALLPVLRGCQGVIHLAAVSRVPLAEADPRACFRHNVEGVTALIAAMLSLPKPPWLLFISSREVYGNAGPQPVTEDHPFAPMNLYGRSKVAGEAIVEAARGAGLRAAILRLSNTYGSLGDYAERVVPAFTNAALMGDPLRVEGSEQRMDLLHIDDAVAGLEAAAHLLSEGEDIPQPIHLTTGIPVTLGELAREIRSLSDSPSPIIEAPPRGTGLLHFCGDPSRAAQLLGWRPNRRLQDGLRDFIDAHRRAHTLGVKAPLIEAKSCEF